MPRHRRARQILALLLPSLLAACFTAPYTIAPSRDAADMVSESRPSEGSSRITIAVCYNGLSNSPAEVMAQAREACPNDGEIERIDEDFFWNPCSLSQPTRASFACTLGETPPSKYQ